jgi:glycosyltransferase involved in cell wall biosynthesis
MLRHRRILPSPPSTDPQVRLRGSLNILTGYGQHMIRTVEQFQKAGIRVIVDYSDLHEAPTMPMPPFMAALIGANPPKDLPPECWDLTIAPPDWRKGGDVTDRPVARFTMWESTHIKREVVTDLNKAKLLILPSEWNQLVFSAAGVHTWSEKVKMGYDPRVFYKRPWIDGAPFRFGTAGKLAHGGIRKGIEEACIAFHRAFPPKNKDVALEVKIFPDDDFNLSVKDKRIKVIRAEWSDVELSNWFASIQCYFTLSKSEGFGLMPLQAMAVGRPVVASPQGGHSEFWHSSCGWPVESELRPVSQAPYWGLWWKPSIEHASEQLRSVVDQQDLAWTRGDIASDWAQQFTWDVYGERLLSVLRSHGLSG